MMSSRVITSKQNPKCEPQRAHALGVGSFGKSEKHHPGKIQSAAEHHTMDMTPTVLRTAVF